MQAVPNFLRKGQLMSTHLVAVMRSARPEPQTLSTTVIAAEYRTAALQITELQDEATSHRPLAESV